MAIVLDSIVVLIILGTVISVVSRGFIKTLLGFCSVIFAVIFGKIFSPVVSTWLYDILYRGTFDGINNVVSDLISENKLPSLLELDSVSNTLSKYNPELATEINSRVTDNMAQAISENIVGLLSYAVAFLVVFILTVILFKILGVILSTIFKLPVLNTINKVLSLGLGCVMAVVYLMIFSAFMQIVLPVVSSVYPEVINMTTVESTVLFEFFYNFEWIKLFVS